MPNKKLTKDKKAYIRNQKKFLLNIYKNKCVCCSGCEYLYYDYGLDFNKNKVEIIKFANMDM